jgi:hypothetical protein
MIEKNFGLSGRALTPTMTILSIMCLTVPGADVQVPGERVRVHRDERHVPHRGPRGAGEGRRAAGHGVHLFHKVRLLMCYIDSS